MVSSLLMKPIPSFTSSDHKLLKKITKTNLSATSAREIKLLMEELERGNIVEDNAIENDIIRINSEVIIEEMSTQKQMKFQIVLRFLFRQNKLSNFSRKTPQYSDQS